MPVQTLAEASCDSEGWSFPDTFRHQYVIKSARKRGPAGWDTVKLPGWHLHHCPHLPVARLTGSDGTAFGCVVGYAIAPDGTMVEDGHVIDTPGKAPDAAIVEAAVSLFAGRYAVLISAGPLTRVYADPTCCFGPVYHPASQAVGTSTGLVLDRPLQTNQAIPRDRIEDGTARYLFGHTADAEVRRVIPNHYLDLADFTLHRHWPQEDTLLDLGDEQHQDLSRAAGEKLTANLQALVARYRTSLPLSGGTDSRLLLAAASDFLDQIPHFFTYYVNWSTSLDRDIAFRLAELTCVPLHVISRDAPQFGTVMSKAEFEETVKKRNLRNGFEVDPSEPRSIRAMKLVPKHDLILRGNVAEMTRALRWRPEVFDDPHNTEYALERLRIDQNTNPKLYPFWKKLFLDWKAGLPANAVPRLYDFLHTELWLPNANGVVFTSEPEHFFINPFNDRTLIALATRIPPKIRRRRRMVNVIIRSHAPLLLKEEYAGQRRKRLAAEAENAA